MPSLGALLSIKFSDEFRAKVFGLDETHHHKVKTMARWMEGWTKAAASNKPGVGKWVAISGAPGCGKSHAVRKAADFLRSHNVELWRARYYSTPPSIRFATWSKVVELGPLAWGDFQEEIRLAKIVVLDDVGSEVDRFKSGEPTERLRSTLEACERKWLAITTNIPQPEWGEKFDYRVASRLEQANTMDMSGVPDYRPKLRGAT